ncbi:hypothetical protein F5Y11DRAFT_315009 [Daldinia sp. FL1419]|nr:hypothetical protein F5Y11DRAFT_315009 [Daldinia sp. FL1419]
MVDPARIILLLLFLQYGVFTSWYGQIKHILVQNPLPSPPCCSTGVSMQCVRSRPICVCMCNNNSKDLNRIVDHTTTTTLYNLHTGSAEKSS